MSRLAIELDHRNQHALLLTGGVNFNRAPLKCASVADERFS